MSFYFSGGILFIPSDLPFFKSVFCYPIAIAKGYLEIAREDHDIDKIKKAINAIERVEKVVKNIVHRGEVRE